MATAVAEPLTIPRATPRAPSPRRALVALARRRAVLTSRTPRQILVPVLGPALLALIAAPALRAATGGLHSHIDYQAFVDAGAVGLLIPFSCILAGISVLLDRNGGAQRELLAAPVPRALLVLGNLIIALGLTTVQIIVLIGLGALRGADFHITAAGIGWFIGGTALFTVFMYGLAEILASRVSGPEEYQGAVPVIAVLPYFFAGGLFPIGAMPGALTAIAKVLPLTHALALVRYAVVDPRGSSLHAIWGMHNPTTEALLSLAVVAGFALALTALSIRVFSRSAVK